MSPKCLLVKPHPFISDCLSVTTCPLPLWNFIMFIIIKEPFSMAASSTSIPSPQRIGAVLLSRDAGVPSPVYISGLNDEIIYMMECPPSYLQTPSYLSMSLNYFLLLNLTISGTSTFPRLYFQLNPFLP